MGYKAHPDKRDSSRDASPANGTPDTISGETHDIILVNEARAVLSDPSKRAAFDAQRAAAAAKGWPTATAPPPASGPRIREYVSLDSFTPHIEGGSEKHHEPYKYTYPCRCGHEYSILLDDLEAGVDVIGCPGCGEFVGVDYEEVDDVHA